MQRYATCKVQVPDRSDPAEACSSLLQTGGTGQKAPRAPRRQTSLMTWLDPTSDNAAMSQCNQCCCDRCAVLNMSRLELFRPGPNGSNGSNGSIGAFNNCLWLSSEHFVSLLVRLRSVRWQSPGPWLLAWVMDSLCCQVPWSILELTAQSRSHSAWYREMTEMTTVLVQRSLHSLLEDMPDMPDRHF